jgi:IMP dehydrogenase
MKFYNKNETYVTYKDVLLVPQESDISHRGEVNLVTRFSSNIAIAFPFVASPMDTVTNPQVLADMSICGGIGILHRFFETPEKHYKAIQESFKLIKKHSYGNLGFAVGLHNYNEIIKVIKENYTRTEDRVAIVLDIAHGGMDDALRAIESIHNLSLVGTTKIFDIVSPSCAGRLTTDRMISAGVDALRIGIGNGSQCTTRVHTGHGFPQLSAISEAFNSNENYDVPIIADGGMEDAGDAVKALAAGASTLMFGKLFAYALESGGWEQTDNTWSKLYYGMASDIITNRAPEGVLTSLELTHKPYNLNTIIQEWVEYIQSGCSYSGARNLIELKNKAKFIKISNMSYLEGLPNN